MSWGRFLLGDLVFPWSANGYPSLKFNRQLAPKKWMVGILLSYWEGPFSGAMLVLGRVIVGLGRLDSWNPRT